MKALNGCFMDVRISLGRQQMRFFGVVKSYVQQHCVAVLGGREDQLPVQVTK